MSVWRAIDEAEGKCETSEDSYINHADRGGDFKAALREIVTECCIPLTTVIRLLLGILQKFTDYDLPSQATTLLNTPRNVDISQKSGKESSCRPLVTPSTSTSIIGSDDDVDMSLSLPPSILPSSTPKQKPLGTVKKTASRSGTGDDSLPLPLDTDLSDDADEEVSNINNYNAALYTPTIKTAKRKIDGPITLKMLYEMQSATHQAVEQILATVKRNEEDMQKLKVALLQHLAEEQKEEVFVLEKHEYVQAFEDFCAKLEDPIFNQLVKRFLVATYGQKAIGPTVRSILKNALTDDLMVQYNLSGTRAGRKFPPLFARCIYHTVKTFCKADNYGD